MKVSTILERGDSVELTTEEIAQLKALYDSHTTNYQSFYHMATAFVFFKMKKQRSVQAFHKARERWLAKVTYPYMRIVADAIRRSDVLSKQQ